MQVYKFNVPTFGPNVVFDVHHKVRAEQIKFFTEALKASKMKDYVPQFVLEAEVRDPAHFYGLPMHRSTQHVPQKYFSKWGEEGVVDLNEELAELIILTATRTLMGADLSSGSSSWKCPYLMRPSAGNEVRETMFREVKDLIHHLDEGMLPISVFFPYLPIPKHRARDRFSTFRWNTGPVLLNIISEN